MNAYNFLMNKALQWASSRGWRADLHEQHHLEGIGQDWKPESYGEWYFKSTAAFAAITVRATAMSRVPLRAYRPNDAGEFDWVPPNHALQRLLDTPNPQMSQSDWIQAIEINTCLWGTAYTTIEFNDGQTELWPMRADKMHTMPGTSGPRHIRGWRYDGEFGQPFYSPEVVTQLIKYNPLEPYAGASPIAPLVATLEMANAAVKHNARIFKNGGIPDYLIIVEGITVQREVDEFYERWDKRFGSGTGVNRPAFMPNVKDVKPMAFSNREMEFQQLMKWYVEEAARVYGVPQPFLGALGDATLQNVANLYRFLWENTLIPETVWIAQRLSSDLLPKLGWPDLRVAFDYTHVEWITEDEEIRLKKEDLYLKEGVLTINQVRAQRGWSPVAWGHVPRSPTTPDPAAQRNEPRTAEHRTNRHEALLAYPESDPDLRHAPKHKIPTHPPANGTSGTASSARS